MAITKCPIWVSPVTANGRMDADPRAIMCCTPTLRWLIVLTLPPRLSLSSRPATGLSALSPAQRAGAQRLCALARNGPADPTERCLLLAAEQKTSALGEYFAF